MVMPIPNAPLSTAETKVTYGTAVPRIQYGHLVERIFPTLTLTLELLKKLSAVSSGMIWSPTSSRKTESVHWKIDKNNAWYASKIAGTFSAHHSFKEAWTMSW
jgi:hypothetical protein